MIHRSRRLTAMALAGVLTTAALGACATAGDGSSTSGPGGAAPTADHTGSRATSVTAFDAGALKSKLAGLVESMNVPSAVVVIRSSTFGDTQFSFGTLELGKDLPPNTQDYYRIGSVAKAMTGTIVLQLVQEGKLALEDPISKYRPEVPNGDNITIAQLLEMRSGLADFDVDPTFRRALDENRTRVWQPQELVAMALKAPPLFAPGARWSYCNTNYLLLGLVMEQLTGKSAQTLMQERIFTPLGLKHTSMPALTDASIPSPYAHGYHYGTAQGDGSAEGALPQADRQAAAAGTLKPNDWSDASLSWGWTAGSVISNADDMVVFVKALVDGQLLKPEMQQRRFASLRPISDNNPPYDYGLALMKSRTYFGHNGQVPGYQSFVVRDPKTDTSLVILTALTVSPDGQNPADQLAYATMDALG